jgi:hypothetical protein
MALFNNKRKDFSIQPPRQQVDGTPFFVTDSANIDFTLANLNLTANLTTTGVIAGTYGSSTLIPILTLDSYGRVTGISTTTFTASGILLQTNTVTNPTQTILNLIQGTNMTITDDGLGNITFDATGGSVTAVTATSPITSSGGTAPVISTSMATNKLIGRGTIGTGVMEEITLGTGLSLSGTTLNATATSGGILHGTASGTDTYTVTITGATAYADGDAYLIRFTNGNTTSATLNISDGVTSFGAIPLYRNNDGPLLGGDVLAGGEMICVYNSTLNIFQCIGVSPNSLIAYVTNDDSVTITKGQPVYAFSGTGDRMTVKLAYNTGDSTSAQTVGLVLSTSIAANQKGLIMMQGLLDGLSNVKPVNGWADGSPVYLGTTAGSITPTKQYAPNHLVYLGFVTTASPGAAGRVYVRVQNGFELDELHNVQAQTPANNDTLYYDNVTTPLKPQWKVASIASILGYTPLSQTLNDTNIFVGNASNVATAVAMSGDTTIANTGVVSLNTSFTAGSFGVTFDGGTALITSGKIGYVRVPYKGTITGWQLVADQSGSCSIAVKQGLFSPFPPTTTIITAALSGTQTSSATGLSLPVAAGDWFSFTITGTSAVQLVNLSISITKII